MILDAHEVAPGLWVGATPPEGTVMPFHVVFLCAVEVQPNLVGTKVVRVPLDDAKPSPEEVRLARAASRLVHQYRRRGAKVLVACAAGINRSAWVAAMAMMRDGYSADGAVLTIRRRRRHPYLKPLFNKNFVAVLQQLEHRPSFAGAA